MGLMQTRCWSLGGKSIGHAWGVTLLMKADGDSFNVSQSIASQFNDMLALDGL